MKTLQTNTLNQYIVAAVTTGTSFTSGLSFSWTSPVQAQITPSDAGGCLYEFCVTKTEFEWIATCMAVGSLLCGFTSGPLMTAYGRKPALIGFFLATFLGWLFLTFAQSVWMLYVGRCLVGAGFGGSGPIVPVYLGEISQTSIRGRLLSMVEMNLQFGMLITYLIGQFFPMFVQNIISLSIVCLYFVPMLFIPESPAYLISVGKIDKAERIIRRLRSATYDVKAEVQSIIDFQTAKETKGFRALVTEKANVKALIISLGLFTSFHFCGFNIVGFYSAEIFKVAGSSTNPNFSATCIGASCVFGTVCALILMDKVGRRGLLLSTYVIMFVCSLTMGTYFYLHLNNPEAIKGLQILPVIILCIFMFTYAVGPAAIIWVIVGEVFAQNIKDTASSITLIWCHSASIIVTILIPIITRTYSFSTTFFIFGGSIFASFLFVFFLVPETKGKTFQEIQNALVKKK